MGRAGGGIWIGRAGGGQTRRSFQGGGHTRVGRGRVGRAVERGGKRAASTRPSACTANSRGGANAPHPLVRRLARQIAEGGRNSARIQTKMVRRKSGSIDRDKIAAQIRAMEAARAAPADEEPLANEHAHEAQAEEQAEDEAAHASPPANEPFVGAVEEEEDGAGAPKRPRVAVDEQA